MNNLIQNYKSYLVVVVLLVISFCAGMYFSPAEIQTKEVEKTVQQENQKIDRNQNVIKTDKETRLPDGTVIKEHSEEKVTSTQTEKQSVTATDKESSKSIENRPGYQLGVLYEPAISNFQQESYQVMVQRRLFSEIYLGLSYSNRQAVGVVLSIGF